ncbi:unnamed protein product [Moneuplotes crassus]|uniref:Uncharacterized protein n=1 Tax=Euplotes crassus TaxID=5936 RepID=A0AAD1Y2Y2_EUPCR|nr:unnamed protein product [Moneuplotes crassus]
MRGGKRKLEMKNELKGTKFGKNSTQNSHATDSLNFKRTSVADTLKKCNLERKLATERENDIKAKSFKQATQKRGFTSTRFIRKKVSTKIDKLKQSPLKKKLGLFDSIRQNKEQSQDRSKRKELSSKIDKLFFSKHHNEQNKSTMSQTNHVNTLDTPKHIQVNILEFSNKVQHLSSRTKNDFFSSTLSDNKLSELHTCSDMKSRKGYVEGEENVKDTEEILDHKNHSHALQKANSQLNSVEEVQDQKIAKLSGQQHPKNSLTIGSKTDRNFIPRTCRRIDKDPMWLVNVIRQSSKESHQLSRKREDSASGSRNDYSKSSRKGFYNKSRAQHQYISSRKGSSKRVTHSQNRMIKFSQNHSKLYMNLANLN